MINRIMKDENGVLTFEWILLITVLVIGIVGGVAIMRDALILEAAETADAIVHLSQSYEISGPIMITVTDTTSDMTEASLTEYSGANSKFSDIDGTVTVTPPSAG